MPTAQGLAGQAVSWKELFAGADGQIADRTHRPKVTIIIDGRAALVRKLPFSGGEECHTGPK
jgi:hypothetical protein